jgi:hypothetical protein
MFYRIWQGRTDVSPRRSFLALGKIPGSAIFIPG